MQAKLSHMAHTEALQAACMQFNEAMTAHCMRAVTERDARVVRLADDRGAEALHAFRQVGALEPPWVEWKRSKVRHAVRELMSSLEQTRPNREFALRARIVRTATDAQYTQQRKPPQSFALPDVEHVISVRDVERLRRGSALVLDPNPPLLGPREMAEAHAELAKHVREGGVMLSHNPCNAGSHHGMLPVSGSGTRLGASTCQLLRKLCAAAATRRVCACVCGAPPSTHAHLPAGSPVRDSECSPGPPDSKPCVAGATSAAPLHRLS
uniref:Uncharacterized protein n=1 Tax=Haptolina ericina TaxID=156174 RepID=A0A7S3AVJ0_9EUKA